MSENSKVLKVVSLLPKKNQKLWEDFSLTWSKYFNVEHIIDVPENQDKYIGKGMHLLFLHHSKLLDMEYSSYKENQIKNRKFKYILIKDKREESDFNLFKALVDDIVYLDIEKLAKWKSLALLRRYWNTFSRPTTIIHGNIIADFLDNVVIVNNKEVRLTMKELKLLRYLLENKDKVISRNKIFKDVWGYEEDQSRSVDQMLFKLKKKIGYDFVKFKGRGFRIQ